MTRVLVVAESVIMRAGLEAVIVAAGDRSSSPLSQNSLQDSLQDSLEDNFENNRGNSLEAPPGRSWSRRLQVVGSIAPGAHLPQQIDTLQPDVVLLEVSATEDVIALLAPLEAEPPNLAIALLIDELQPDWLGQALRLGVRSVLPVESSAAELVTALEAAALGLLTLHPDIAEGWLSTLPGPRSLPEPGAQPLTPREVEVLQMLAEGLGNKAIARRLQISEHTVKFHIGSLFTKLHASSRTEAVMLGARQGLILL